MGVTSISLCCASFYDLLAPPITFTGMCYTIYNQFMPICSLILRIYSGSNDWLNATCTEEKSCNAGKFSIPLSNAIQFLGLIRSYYQEDHSRLCKQK